MSSKGTKYSSKSVFGNSTIELVLADSIVESYRIDGKLKLPENVWRFDSQHEFRVYLELVRMYGSECVYRQHKVHIIKPGCCYPNGKTWRADFAICFPKTYGYVHWLVEAKGAFLPEFSSVLSRLEDTRNDLFYRTIIVFPRKIPDDNRVVKALLKSDVAKNLITLKDLKNLQQLP